MVRMHKESGRANGICDNSNESRICVIKETRRIITDPCRKKQECTMITTYARAYQTHARTHANSEREIKRTQDS